MLGSCDKEAVAKKMLISAGNKTGSSQYNEIKGDNIAF